MNKNLRIRYLFAIYAIVVAIATIFGFLAFNRANDAWQSMLLNLSTELLGVVLVFFLVNVVFFIDDWDLSERVKELIQKLGDPSAQDFFKAPLDPQTMQKYFQDAKKIDLLGVTLTTTLNRNFSTLRQKLYDGVDIRIMIIYPHEETLQSAAYRSESGSVGYFRRRLEAALNDVAYLHSSLDSYLRSNPRQAGNLEVGLLPYTPSIGMIHFDFGTEENVISVEMYPHHTGYDLPPNFCLTKEKDEYWYDYFATQFEEMWKRTKPWQPGMRNDFQAPGEHAD